MYLFFYQVEFLISYLFQIVHFENNHEILRLQLKRGLFWYRHYPKWYQMVKYRSSRALVWTSLRQISLRVFFTLKKLGGMTMWSKRNKIVVFREKIFEKLHASHQSWKKTNVPI